MTGKISGNGLTYYPPSLPLCESASNKNDKKKKNDDLTFYH